MCRLRFRAKQQLTVLELRCRLLPEPLLLHNTPGEPALYCIANGTTAGETAIECDHARHVQRGCGGVAARGAVRRE